MSNWADVVVGFVVVILTMVVMGALLALPVMLLWNMVMPQLFGLNSITFLQALWLSLLFKFLFGGIKVGKGKDNG